jgi:hypothetical protein
MRPLEGRRGWIAILLALACGDPSGPDQTIHDAPITKDQTWSRADSPHLVRGKQAILGGVTLTIEAGATVLFDSLASLTFGRPVGSGTLLALGSAAAPITMRSLQEASGPGAWIGLTFRSNTASVLRHVNVSGCGSARRTDSIPPACLALGNPFLPEESPTLLIDHVTVEDGRGGAVALWNQSEFGAGSSVLSVRNMKGYVARLRAREAARFPLGGTFAGNDTNEVQLTADTLRDSLTLVNGIPWAVEGDVLIEGPKEPVLTIPAGATILLSASLIAGQDAPGGLQIGTDGGPTVNLLPRSTTWEGLQFRAYAVHSSISDAVLESCGPAGTSCVSLQGSFTGGPAPTPVLRNVTIRDAVGSGMAMAYNGRPGPGSTNLRITGAGEMPIFVHQSPLSSIPSGQYTGNFRDLIWINQLDIRQDETWPRFDAPYFIYNWVSVGDDATDPTLTVAPGVTVISAAGVSIRVGETAPGAIHAVGTVAEPITFTGETYSPGSWTGIAVSYHADPSTVFDHVIVDNAGAPYPVQGSFHFYTDIGPVIRNSMIRNSAGCGVIVVNGAPWSTDFTAPALGNTFTNNVGGAVC